VYNDVDRFVTRTELWLQWADAHGVRYDDVGKSFDDVGRDYHQTSDAYREVLAPELRSPSWMGEWDDVARVPFAAHEELPQPHDAPTRDRGFRL